MLKPQVIMSDLKPKADHDLSFNINNLDTDKLVKVFAECGRVHIPNFLNAETAVRIHQFLINQTEWNLTWNNNGKHQDLSYTAVMGWTEAQKNALLEVIHTQAQRGFQYYYSAIPIYDIYLKKLMPGHFFNEIYEFLNQPQLVDFARKVTSSSSICFADMQATRYSSGHFLNEHDDNVEGKNRVAAYVLNFTPVWRNEWGGALVFPNNEQALGDIFFPTFNAINIFAVPQKHSVSFVAPFAAASRYSITGWFRY